MTPTTDPTSWIETLQALLHYCLPPLPNSPAVNVGGLLAIAVGLFLVFRGWKFDRAVVSAFGLVLGAWLGYEISTLVRTPGPISAAVAGVLVTLLAYRTYKWWLAVGSVVVLFGLAMVFQLGRGDLQRYLPAPEQIGLPLQADRISGLVSREEQLRNLHPDWKGQFDKVKDRVLTELKDLGPGGWLLPAAAAVLGGLLAYWALRAFSVIWMGFLGASVAVAGACTLLCAHWPGLRTSLFDRPQIPAGVAIGLWLLGLIVQAKEVRLPKKQPAANGDSAKS